MKKWSAIVAFGLAFGLMSAAAMVNAATDTDADADTEAPVGVPGMEAERIKEPVFGGHAYVYQAGREHARTILLVHGLGNVGARDFAEHVPWLARSYHVIAVDLPGFGQSDKANVIYSPTNYAAFLKHVVDRYARKPFVLVGHSMGGVIALRYAATHARDVDRLVVIDAPGILHRYAFSSHFLAHLGLDFLPPAVDPVPKLANIARKVLERVARSNFEPEVILMSPTLRDTMLGGDPGKIAGLAVAIDDLSQQLAAIDMPTQLIWGKQDTTAPLRTGKVLARMLPQARLAVIERAAHVPMEETPEKFRAILESFLTNGLPVEARAVAMKQHGSVRCSRKKNLVYEGDYDRLTLSECKDVRIRNARIRELQLNGSTVTIEDSHLGGGEVALYAIESMVEMTNVRLEAEVAIFANSSRFDVAGADIEAKEAVMRVRDGSTIAFSLCRVRSPALNGMVHNFYGVTEEKPL